MKPRSHIDQNSEDSFAPEIQKGLDALWLGTLKQRLDLCRAASRRMLLFSLDNADWTAGLNPIPINDITFLYAQAAAQTEDRTTFYLLIDRLNDLNAISSPPPLPAELALQAATEVPLISMHTRLRVLRRELQREIYCYSDRASRRDLSTAFSESALALESLPHHRKNDGDHGRLIRKLRDASTKLASTSRYNANILSSCSDLMGSCLNSFYSLAGKISIQRHGELGDTGNANWYSEIKLATTCVHDFGRPTCSIDKKALKEVFRKATQNEVSGSSASRAAGQMTVKSIILSRLQDLTVASSWQIAAWAGFSLTQVASAIESLEAANQIVRLNDNQGVNYYTPARFSSCCTAAV